MRPILAALLLGFELAFGPTGAQVEPSAVEMYTTTLTISTYPYAAFLETHHSDVYNMDYPWLNRAAYEASDPQPSPRDYEALVVENAWLRLTILPELGGRLYGVTVKATGEELFYQNPVVKPTRWGPAEQSWWLAVGGIEWCLPVEEHGYEWAVPWSYESVIVSEGVTVTLRDTIATDRVRAQIRIHLPADQATFKVSPRLENPTPAPVTLRFWDNAMLAPGQANTVGPELRFVVPINQVTVHSTGDPDLPEGGKAMDWPVHNGKDYSRLGNWNQWLGFFARPQAARDWTGVYDEGTERGVARVFPHQVAVGVKGFAFGWHQALDPNLWTDDGSTYVELHGGPSPTFWDAITLDAGETLEWTETWLPLRDLPRLSLATRDLALGLKAVGVDLHLGLLVASQQQGISARLWRASDCALLWSEDDLLLSPGTAYTHRLEDVDLETNQVLLAVFKDNVLLAATGDQTCWPPNGGGQHFYLPLVFRGSTYPQATRHHPSRLPR